MTTHTFDAELRAILEPVVSQLASDLQNLILSRLLGSAGVPPRAATKATRAVTQKPSKPAAAAPKAPAKKKARASRNPADAAARRARILEVVQKGPGLSASDVAKATGYPRETVDYSLRILRKEKRVFMAGNRGSARWAGSAEAARKAVGR
jgi:hypothetical protein